MTCVNGGTKTLGGEMHKVIGSVAIVFTMVVGMLGLAASPAAAETISSYRQASSGSTFGTVNGTSVIITSKLDCPAGTNYTLEVQRHQFWSFWEAPRKTFTIPCGKTYTVNATQLGSGNHRVRVKGFSGTRTWSVQLRS